MKRFLHHIIFVVILVLACSCSPLKHISEDGYLLSKNKVECDSKLINTSDLNNLIKQDPNGTFLGVHNGAAGEPTRLSITFLEMFSEGSALNRSNSILLW